MSSTTTFLGALRRLRARIAEADLRRALRRAVRLAFAPFDPEPEPQLVTLDMGHDDGTNGEG